MKHGHSRKLIAACLPLLLAACAQTPQDDGPVAQAAPAATAAPQPAPAASQPQPPKRKVAMVGPGRSIEDYIRIMDANEDGAVTPDEVDTLRLERFRLADTNGDGGIDMKEYSDEYRLRLKERIQEFMKDEDHMTAVRFDSMADASGYITRARYDQSGDRAYQAYAQGKLSDKQASGRGLGMSTTHTKAGMLALYDRNLDGKLPRQEYDLMRDEQFKRTDINKDGRLSRGEYVTEFDQRVDARLHEIKTREMRQARVRFGVLDANKDDRIDQNEYLNTARQMFKRLDRNGDGRVDKADAALPAPEPERAAKTLQDPAKADQADSMRGKGKPGKGKVRAAAKKGQAAGAEHKH